MRHTGRLIIGYRYCVSLGLLFPICFKTIRSQILIVTEAIIWTYIGNDRLATVVTRRVGGWAPQTVVIHYKRHLFLSQDFTLPYVIIQSFIFNVGNLGLTAIS